MTPGSSHVGQEGSLEPVIECADRLARAGGGALDVVVFYGSRLHGAGPDQHSVIDFVTVVSDYRRFFRSLRSSGLLHRPTWLMSLAARVLPPTSIAFRPVEEPWLAAKCLVVSREHLMRALGPEAPDHFLLARLCQMVQIVWVTSPEAEAWARRELCGAVEQTLRWAGPFLPPLFDEEYLGRRMLEVSYGSELRPESGDRPAIVFEAQRERLLPLLASVLQGGVRREMLVRVGSRYRFASPPTPAETRRIQRYLRRSKRRSTLRWLKHVMSFDGWLTYAVKKVERRTGSAIHLNPLERRWPLVFLWPRVLRVFRDRPAREGRR